MTTSCRTQIGESNGTQTGNQLLRLNASPLKGLACRQAQPDKWTQVGPNYAPTRVPFTCRFPAWVENHQRAEIARLRTESKRLSEEYERATGEPFRLTTEEHGRLVEKSKGMDPEQLKNASVLHPDDLARLIEDVDAAENQ